MNRIISRCERTPSITGLKNEPSLPIIPDCLSRAGSPPKTGDFPNSNPTDDLIGDYVIAIAGCGMPSVSAPIKKTFKQRIAKQFIHGSAIDPDLVKSAVEFIEDTGYWETHQALGFEVHTQWQTRKPHDFGTLAGLKNEDNSFWQFKPEKPLTDKKGKTQRYAAPKGGGLRAFLPAVTVDKWVQIAEKHHLKGYLPTWVTQAASNNQNELRSNTSQLLTPDEFKRCADRLNSTSALRLSRKASMSPGFSLDTTTATFPNSQMQQDCINSSTQKPKCDTLDEIQTTAISESESSPICNHFKPLRRDSTLGEVQRLQNQFPIETSSFWQWVELLNIPIILTEGAKKSLALLSHGYVAIALYGVRCGVLENDIINGEKIRRLKPELIPDLQRFAFKGRKITIAFDQDDKPKTRADVSAALSRLGFVLGTAGCQVEIAQWSQTQGKGVDDLIVNCGAGAWEKAHSEAISFAQWAVSRQLAHEVRRKPDLNIGDREFVEVAAELPKTGIIALHGGKGTGKSKAIGLMIKSFRWLSFTHLTSVARDQAAGLGGVFVNDGDRHGSSLLKDGKPVDGGSVCLPSLFKVAAVEAKVLILDETSALLEFLLISKLCNKDGIRSLLLAEFSRRIKEADLVSLADADLSEEALEYIEAIRGERAYLVRSERKALTYDAFIIDGNKNEAIAMLLERVEEKRLENKVFYINADSKALTETLAEILGRDKCLVINGDTIGGKAQASLLSSKGHDLPGLILQGIRYIISSPSVVQGFSFEHHTNLIDSFWGFYGGGSIIAHAIAQAPDRIRDSDIDRFFWVAKKGSAYSKLSKAQSVAAFLKEFKQLNTTAARLVRNSLTPETQVDVDCLDWQSQNMKMLAAIEVRRNRGMVNLRETLIALLKKEGKKVSVIAPTENLPNVSRIVKEASEAVSARYCLAVENAETITKEEADKFADATESLTPEQILSLEKFYMGEFYRLENVKAMDVQFDRKGRTKAEIKALEALLVPGLAEEVTSKTINKNATTPQDWNPIAVKAWLLEQSGAAAAIRRIAAGKITSIDSKTVEEIASFIRAHQKEFRIAFGFRSLDKMSDQQIIGEILSRHGIKTNRAGNKNNLRYEVDKPHLQAILAIIERRKTAIAPLEDQGLNQRGAIPKNTDPELQEWMNPESFADIRAMWSEANTPESVEALKSFIPIVVLELAIAS